jgi:hypothetical protein
MGILGLYLLGYGFCGSTLHPRKKLRRTCMDLSVERVKFVCIPSHSHAYIQGSKNEQFIVIPSL